MNPNSPESKRQVHKANVS